MEEMVSVDSLHFKYNNNLVLKDMTFNVNKGDFLCILGPNGSGKSTLLKTITSILNPCRGKVQIFGKDINRYKSKELSKKMAFVPQNINIEYDFKVHDIILMGRSPFINKFSKESKTDFEIVDYAMEITDTVYLKDRFINEISGGERQRVIIARALAQETELIVLDEPTSSLDINHQIEILDLLYRLNKEKNKTIIMVMHDINLAARFSNKILLINDGSIVKLGNPKEVITKEVFEQIYHMDIFIKEEALTNSPYIIPLSIKKN